MSTTLSVTCSARECVRGTGEECFYGTVREADAPRPPPVPV